MKKHSVYLLILVLFTAGVFAYSSQKTLSQYDNTSAVTISNVRADNITQTSARILWDTNVAVDQSTVYWGTEPGVLSNGTTANDKCSSSSGSIDTANCVEILGLSPATVYYYKVQVYKTGGNLVHSSEYSFTTVTGETSGTGSDGNESTTNDPIDNTVSVAASLTGLVTNTLGTGISDAIVKIYTENYSFSIHGKTDSTGRYNIGNIPAGSYFVQVYIPTTSGYVAPEREYIVLSGGQSAELNFVLRWTTISISGKVFNGAEFAPGAFVWGWSEGGSYRSTEANSDGTYVLPVSPLDSWRMGAYLKKDDVFYRAEEIKIDAGAFKPGENIYSQDIYLQKAYTLTFSKTETTFDASTEIKVIHEEGAEIEASGGSISSTGSIKISIRPDIEAPTQEDKKRAIGVAYDLEARDAFNNLITTFQKKIRVKLPYKVADVAGQGSIAENLSLHYWDDVAGTWIEVENSTVDKLNNFVSADVDHFTRFAVLAFASGADVSGIADGDLIKTADNPDVYIAKLVGNKKYKRLILNPEIFNSYGHLKWSNIKTVTQTQIDSFFLSELTMEVYPDGTPVNGKVYVVSSAPNSDVGISQRLDIAAEAFEQKGFDWEGIFYINHHEASPDFYPEGAPITS